MGAVPTGMTTGGATRTALRVLLARASLAARRISASRGASPGRAASSRRAVRPSSPVSNRRRSKSKRSSATWPEASRRIWSITERRSGSPTGLRVNRMATRAARTPVRFALPKASIQDRRDRAARRCPPAKTARTRRQARARTRSGDKPCWSMRRKIPTAAITTRGAIRRPPSRAAYLRMRGIFAGLVSSWTAALTRMISPMQAAMSWAAAEPVSQRGLRPVKGRVPRKVATRKTITGRSQASSPRPRARAPAASSARPAVKWTPSPKARPISGQRTPSRERNPPTALKPISSNRMEARTTSPNRAPTRATDRAARTPSVQAMAKWRGQGFPRPAPSRARTRTCPMISARQARTRAPAAGTGGTLAFTGAPMRPIPPRTDTPAAASVHRARVRGRRAP